MRRLIKAKAQIKCEHWTRRWNWRSCTNFALSAGWTHGLIAQSVRAAEQNSVGVGSNPTQANFLKLLLRFQYYIIYFSKFSNLRPCSQNNVITYYQNYITIYGFTNYFKNKVRKSLVDTTWLTLYINQITMLL